LLRACGSTRTEALTRLGTLAEAGLRREYDLPQLAQLEPNLKPQIWHQGEVIVGLVARLPATGWKI
jgi:hypothetical protein